MEAHLLACLSPNGCAVSRNNGPANVLLVGTLRGVWALTRENPRALWHNKLRGLADRHISSLLYLPEKELLIAGCHGRGDEGGLFISRDLGHNWAPRTNGMEHTHVYTLAAERRGVDIVLYAGVEPPAVYRSRDLGESWEELPSLKHVPGTDKWTFPPPPHIAHVKNIAFHPSQPGTLYVLVEQGAVLKSTDDGKTWRELDGYVSPSDSFYHDVHRLAIASSDPKRMHLATGDGLYYSTDGGETWEHQQDRKGRIGYPDALFLDPESDDVVYVGGAHDAPETWRKEGGAFPGFIASNDCGRTWSERMAGLPKPIEGNIEAMAMHSWPNGVAFYAGTAIGQVFGSEDRGQNWSLIAEGLPPISKARHYRHFLSADEKKRIEDEARAERRAEGLPDRAYSTNP